MTTRPYRDPLEDATLLDPAGGQTLRLRFGGSYHDANIRWDACIEALPPGQANYFEIGAPGEHGTALRLGLRTAQLDLPTVRKAIVMIRQYRRLTTGRREFG